jgi:hypothetical protein
MLLASGNIHNIRLTSAISALYFGFARIIYTFSSLNIHTYQGKARQQVEG